MSVSVIAVARHVLVSGRVQGVGYRDWAARRARGWGLSGWVRNLADGRVEAIVAGPEGVVTAFVDACHDGPPAARVEAVEASVAEFSGEADFYVRST